MDEMRQKIVDEAKTWLLTPWRHEARVKGAGVDCGNLLIAVFHAVGIIPEIELAHYPADFMLHNSREWFLEIITQYCDEIKEGFLPGDIIIYKQGRLFSHGGIILDWPLIIHASADEGMVAYGDASKDPLEHKECRMFRLKALEGE